MIRRFTAIVEFRGGTYISQLHTTSVSEAVAAWMAGPWPAEIDDLSADERVTLIDQLADEEPTPLEGLEAVWCVAAVVGDDLALVHLVG